MRAERWRHALAMRRAIDQRCKHGTEDAADDPSICSACVHEKDEAKNDTVEILAEQRDAARAEAVKWRKHWERRASEHGREIEKLIMEAETRYIIAGEKLNRFDAARDRSCTCDRSSRDQCCAACSMFYAWVGPDPHNLTPPKDGERANELATILSAFVLWAARDDWVLNKRGTHWTCTRRGQRMTHSLVAKWREER